MKAVGRCRLLVVAPRRFFSSSGRFTFSLFDAGPQILLTKFPFQIGNVPMGLWFHIYIYIQKKI
jgi:hypothetical protein